MTVPMHAEQTVALLGAYLAGTASGHEVVRLHDLVAGRLRQDPVGETAYAQLTRAPADQGTRQIVVAILANALTKDAWFDTEVERALRDTGSRYGESVHNTMSGQVTGNVVQAGKIGGDVAGRDIRKSRKINTGGILVLITVLLLGVGGTVYHLATRDTTGSSSGDLLTGSPVLATTTVVPTTDPTTTEPAAPPPQPPPLTVQQGESSSDGGCGSSGPRPVLTVSPGSGPADTFVTVSGTGHIKNGVVSLTFHADEMGEATTDCAGSFSVSLSIPNADSYRRFAGQTFEIHGTEYTSGGVYQGNGDFNGAPFTITG